MSCYGPLAAWYDQLTGDVPYERFADLYEAAFARDGGEFHLLLDLCCGTGTLTAIMTRRGYELIAADSSVDMLMQARDKSADLEPAPLFLLQDAAELDLYGTVDAAFCSLDGINYLPPDALPEVFRRLHLFIRPGGLLIFDMRTPEWLEGLDGQVFVDETDDLLCLWRADYDRKKACVVYGMDLFSREKKLWKRSREEHVEYAHRPEALCRLLTDNGFSGPEILRESLPLSEGRLFYCCKRNER